MASCSHVASLYVFSMKKNRQQQEDTGLTCSGAVWCHPGWMEDALLALSGPRNDWSLLSVGERQHNVNVDYREI